MPAFTQSPHIIVVELVIGIPLTADVTAKEAIDQARDAIAAIETEISPLNATLVLNEVRFK